MSVAGLYAGIGGFELAFAQAGYPTSLLAEIDSAARAVLEARFPNVDLRSDVLDVVGVPPGTTTITAGFPCQNLSMAGDKSGIGGPKSAEVEKLFELIDRSRVPIVVIENVYFMLQLDSGNGMQRLVEAFETRKYRWAYRVLDTMGFGLPQRRRRVYFVASHDIDPRRVLFADDAPLPQPRKADLSVPLGFYWTEGRSGIGITVDGIPPLKIGSAVGIPSAPAVLFPDGEVLMPSLAACEQLQGFPAGWTAAANGNGGRRPEWRLVGNAVSVPVAKWVAEKIKAPGDVLEFEQFDIQEGRRWPDAGWNVENRRVGVRASDKPVVMTKPSISEFRDATWTRLTDRALDGFIERVEAGGLRTPEGFVAALQGAGRKPVRAA